MSAYTVIGAPCRVCVNEYENRVDAIVRACDSMLWPSDNVYDLPFTISYSSLIGMSAEQRDAIIGTLAKLHLEKYGIGSLGGAPRQLFVTQ